MPSRRAHSFLDPLYGELTFRPEIVHLIDTPAIQRLRHVRLSNIDSIDLPSIANISRFEHVLGVAHLAECSTLRSHLDDHDGLVLVASALLHDWSITSFGHLVEEALQYTGEAFDHEQRLYQLITGSAGDLLGADLQIFQGQQTGIVRWARTIMGDQAHSLLTDVTQHIRGKGKSGPLVAGDIDVDNIDNIFRMLFHMGGLQDRGTAERLARGITSISTNGRLILKDSVLPEVNSWLDARQTVYSHLMLSPRDFVGKTMLLYAAVRAFETGTLSRDDWRLTDTEFVSKLSASTSQDVTQAVTRWQLGDLWDTSPLFWMSGSRPAYTSMLAFSHELSHDLGRTCFAYAIKDKRTRRLTVEFESGDRVDLGTEPDRWLLGVTSAVKRPFARRELSKILASAAPRFKTEPMGTAGSSPSSASLF